MNNISSIKVKDENSVRKYASQYVNGEQITLITKDGTKYYTDGKGGYFLLEEDNSSSDITPEPDKAELMETLKELAKNADILKCFKKDKDGNLMFEGNIVSNIPNSPSGNNEPLENLSKTVTVLSEDVNNLKIHSHKNTAGSFTGEIIYKQN